MKFLPPCALLLMTLFACFIYETGAYNASEIYGSLPEQDKSHFVRYYLAKGFIESGKRNFVSYPGMNFPNDLHIPEDTVKAFQQVEIEPKTFPEQLLDHYCKKLNLTRFELFYGVMASCNVCDCKPCDKYICVPATLQCIKTGDNGGICCT